MYRKIDFRRLNQKPNYLRPFLSFLQFPKFLKQNFIYFGRKHVEAGRICSHELAIFLKCHMPLMFITSVDQSADVLSDQHVVWMCPPWCDVSIAIVLVMA